MVPYRRTAPVSDPGLSQLLPAPTGGDATRANDIRNSRRTLAALRL